MLQNTGLFMPGVQKNVGPAGVQIVIIREDLIREDLPEWCPTMLKYKTHTQIMTVFIIRRLHTVSISAV